MHLQEISNKLFGDSFLKVSITLIKSKYKIKRKTSKKKQDEIHLLPPFALKWLGSLQRGDTYSTYQLFFLIAVILWITGHLYSRG